MSKQYKTLFDGVDFEVVTAPRERKSIIDRFHADSQRGWKIYDAYKRTSVVKYQIWEQWVNYFKGMSKALGYDDDYTFCDEEYVSGAGRFTFSITAKVGNNVFFITKDHYKVVEL